MDAEVENAATTAGAPSKTTLVDSEGQECVKQAQIKERKEDCGVEEGVVICRPAPEYLEPPINQTSSTNVDGNEAEKSCVTGRRECNEGDKGLDGDERLKGDVYTETNCVPPLYDETSNDSTTLHIVLPSNENSRKRSFDIDKEIEEDIERELEKKSKKSSLTVKKVKSILRVSSLFSPNISEPVE